MEHYQEIVKVKDKIFNSTLLVGILLGITTFLLSLRNFYISEIRINYFLTLLAIIGMLMVFLFRHKLSHKFKSLGVIAGVLVLSFADIYKLGPYSNAKVLLVLIPFFSLISLSNKRTIIISFFVLLLFILFGFLFTEGVIKSTVDLNDRTVRIMPWIVNIMILAIVAYGIMEILRHYNAAFFKLIMNLEEQNEELKKHRENLEGLVAERSKELELANEELTTMNEELYQNKNIIENQNIELKSTLENLKATQLKLVQSEKMATIGLLSAGVAHEINNPLNFINGGLIGLKKYFEKSKISDESNVNFLLESIKTGVERASKIVSALNQFSRSDIKAYEACNIHEIIDNCLTVLYNQFNNEINISKEYSSDSAQVIGNCGQLHQVFFNILNNAFQSVSLKGKISIKTFTLDNKLIAEVVDTGCGIKPSDLDHITEPFFTTKDPGQGIGLGLSIASMIIREYNGKLEFESELGKGTMARVTFPSK